MLQEGHQAAGVRLTRDPEIMKRCAERGYVPFVSGPLMSTEQIAVMRDVYVAAYSAAGWGAIGVWLHKLELPLMGEFWPAM